MGHQAHLRRFMADELEKLIEVKDVTYIYSEGSADEVKALSRVSFDVKKGEFIALIGHNGSGKSTLARLLNGLLLPTEGKILVKGIETTVTRAKDIFAIRSSVGVVFQNPDNQMVASIIEEDVAFGPGNLGVDREELRKRVDEALGAVGMTDHKNGTPFKLSGGQKQRISIAGVLAMRPDVIVLDEATAMLDPRGRKEIMQVIRRLRSDYGTTIIMITHFTEEAALADRVIVLGAGEIIKDGLAGDVLTDIDGLEKVGLGAPLATRLARGLGIGEDRKIISIEELGRALT